MNTPIIGLRDEGCTVPAGARNVRRRKEVQVLRLPRNCFPVVMSLQWRDPMRTLRLL
jgi:hypothetical protein